MVFGTYDMSESLRSHEIRIIMIWFNVLWCIILFNYLLDKEWILKINYFYGLILIEINWFRDNRKREKKLHIFDIALD